MTAYRCKPITITANWDGGHRLDLRLAEITHEYWPAGTFYMASASPELASANRLPHSGFARISEKIEINSYTLIHRSITSAEEKALTRVGTYIARRPANGAISDMGSYAP